ncbi:MAG: hypothetical protein P9L92_13485 [Candidatus Electryonea clarkiae]|nr:hypothetical protein [Candidatus Electryonea clarkiae]MDP8288914.1 hypothetical protein [Candidatus Electryonea clarkiae]
MDLWSPKGLVRKILSAIASGSGVYLLLDQLGGLATAGVILLIMGLILGTRSNFITWDR